MHHTDLGGRLRENAPDALREAAQVVGAGDEDVLHAPGPDVGEHAHPEGGALALREPHAQQLLAALAVEAHGQVDGLADDLAAVAHLEGDAVHPHDAVEPLQGPLLPLGDVLAHAVGDGGDGGLGDRETVDLPQLLLDVARAHAHGVKGDDQLLDALGQAAPLGHQHRLKGAGPVAGHLDLHLSVLAPELLACLSVARVAAVAPFGGVLLVAQVVVQLSLQHLLGAAHIELLHEGGEVFGVLELLQKLRVEDVVFAYHGCVNGYGS